MKPSRFAYHAPTSLDEALGVLAEVGHDGKVLAGGQSLIPVMSMRLAAPGHLIDINGLAELAWVRIDDDAVRVGALARHADIERDAVANNALPLLRSTLALVAHPAIRNRGTAVGSLAHADPAAELPAVLALLGGSVQVASRTGERTVDAADLFVGPLETSLQPDELVVSASFPRLPDRTGAAIVEVSRRHGDFALAGVVATVTVDDDGRVTDAKAACFAVGPVPLLFDLTDAVADGGTPDWRAAGRLTAREVDPQDDIHATAAYRRHLVDVLTQRALRNAAAEVTDIQEPPIDRGMTA